MVESTKDAAFWRQQVDLALQTRQTHEKWWEAGLKSYAPQPGDRPDDYGAKINTNRIFTLVERKKTDLFYQKPDVSLQPSPLLDGPIMGPPDPMTGQPAPMLDAQGQPVQASAALASHQTIVNELLGPDNVDALQMVHPAIFDVELCGVGWTEMGYDSVTLPQETVDPMTGEPIMVDVPIFERCFWEHFSPMESLVPHDWRSTVWDRAPWLGRRFQLPLTAGNRQKFRLPEDFEGSQAGKSQAFEHGQGTPRPPEQVFTGTRIWYRSSLYREDRPHPEHLTFLVLVDGIDEPVIHEDSPHQTLDEQGGLTPDSLRGFPIHPLNTRTLTDSAYPPSDATLVLPLTNELDLFRTQMVQFRDAQLMQTGYNVENIPRESIEKAARNVVGGLVGLPQSAFPIENNIAPLRSGSIPRESFTSNDYIDNDIARTTAIDAAGAGVQSGGSTTATEQQIVAANANARLDFERGVVLQWYVRGVTKFSTLIQRYLPLQQAVQIVGPQAAQLWDTWRKQVASTVAFTALPDSALRVDQASDRKQSQELYSFLANDPFVNRQELLKGLLRKFHLDPAKIVIQPPAKTPEPPKMAISIKMEDFVLPQAPITVEIATQLGLKISPTAVQQSQQLLLNAQAMQAAEAAEAEAGAPANTKHGGKVAQQESLSKHASDQTGGMQGTGGPAALGQGGGFLQ